MLEKEPFRFVATCRAKEESVQLKIKPLVVAREEITGGGVTWETDEAENVQEFGLKPALGSWQVNDQETVVEL